MEEHRGKLRVYINPMGLWEIDQVYGKHIVNICLTHPNGEMELYDAPTHDFCEEYVDKMLEAEHNNDTFEFNNGVFGHNSKRPPQLDEKIDRLQKVLDKWKKKNSKGLESFM